MRLGRTGIERNRSIIACQRGFRAAQSLKRDPAVAEDRGIVGLEPNCSIEADQRFIETLQDLQDAATSIEGRRIERIERNRRVEARQAASKWPSALNAMPRL